MRKYLLMAFGALLFAGVGMESVRTASAKDEPAATSTKDIVKHGQYLVTLGGCNDCHTPKKMTPEGPVPDMTRELSGFQQDKKLPEIPKGVIGPMRWGGLASDDLTAWVGPWGISFAANLTPDKATGLGKWTPELFMQAMKTGRHEGTGRAILPPMPWYALATLTEEDLRAIFAYLQSIPAVANKVPEHVPPAP